MRYEMTTAPWKAPASWAMTCASPCETWAGSPDLQRDTERPQFVREVLPRELDDEERPFGGERCVEPLRRGQGARRSERQSREAEPPARCGARRQDRDKREKTPSSGHQAAFPHVVMRGRLPT